VQVKLYSLYKFLKGVSVYSKLAITLVVLTSNVDFSSLHKFTNSLDAIDCSLLTG